MKLFERYLEKKLIHRLHRNRARFIEEAIQKFIFERNPSPQNLATFKKRLNDEADRVYAIVDRSVLRARIKAANRTFWIGSIASVIIIGVLGAFTGGTAIPFVAPALGAFLAWLIYIGTSKYFYNQRVKAGFDTVIIAIEKEMDEQEEKFDFQKYKGEIARIESTLVSLINRIDSEKNSDNQLSSLIIDQEITQIKTTLNSLVSKVDGLNSKMDFDGDTAVPFNGKMFLNHESFNKEDELFKQLTQLFLSPQHKPINYEIMHVSQNIPQFRNMPKLYIQHSSNFFQPLSSDSLLKAIETNEIYQFKALIENVQKNMDKPMLEVLQAYTTKTGCTFLHYAALFGSSDILNYLLSQGMNSEAKDSNSDTPLDIAIRYGYKDAIIELAKKAKTTSMDHRIGKYLPGS